VEFATPGAGTKVDPVDAVGGAAVANAEHLALRNRDLQEHALGGLLVCDPREAAKGR
jgi:hypothetical protein